MQTVQNTNQIRQLIMENNIQSFLQTDGLTTQLCMYTTAMFEFSGATVAQMAIVLVSLEVIGLGFTQDYS